MDPHLLENTDYKKITGLLNRPRRILLTTHTHPDGDAIGSTLALYWYLHKKGHTIQMMAPDPFPSFLSWLEGGDQILIFSRDPEKCRQAIRESEIIFSLDYNDLSRLNSAGTFVLSASSTRILIDHHLFPADHYDLKISLTETSSTAELIFDFIRASGDLNLLDKRISSCIYTGIVTDTGSFSYSCNYGKTYHVIAELFRQGIDGEQIHRLIYDTYSEQRLRLLGYSLSEKLVVLPEFHTAYISLSAADLQRFHYQIGDTEGVVNFALSMEGINLAALFSERDNSVRISFRSKGNFSVEKLARKHFDGGGHANASGATSYRSLEETVEKFREILPLFRDQLKEVYL